MKRKMKKQHEDHTVLSHDGFRLKSHAGSYGFVEGVKPPRMLVSQSDARKIDACAKRRGIKGVMHMAGPDYARNGALKMVTK